MNRYLAQTIDATWRAKEDLAERELTAETTLESLQLNSIQVLRILVELEEVFAIELDDEDFDLDGIEDLGQIAAMIQAKVPANVR